VERSETEQWWEGLAEDLQADIECKE